jgi:endo-1,4-beta-xylanase
MAFAKANKLEVRCHNLVWHSQLPLWVSSGNFTNATLISIMENHIKNLAGRYKNQCTQWDVVNEALEEDGTYRKSVWYNTIGEAFLPIAFRFAKKYAGSKTLLFCKLLSQIFPHFSLLTSDLDNDYNIESNNAKTAGAVRIVKLIKSYGLQIDGVGYQAHLASETTPTSGGPAPDQKTLEAALRATADLGVDVAYTELDVRFNTPATPEKLAVPFGVSRTSTAGSLVFSRVRVRPSFGMRTTTRSPPTLGFWLLSALRRTIRRCSLQQR